MNAKEKTAKILRLLEHRHDGPEWAHFLELSVRTGFSPQRIDFFAMNVWPSKKFWRIAYEIKVSRSDFANEIKKPDKRKAAERLANECFFVTPPNLVAFDEIPEGWGLIEMFEGKGGLKRKKIAKQRNEDTGVPITFVAALARRTSDPPPEIPSVTWQFAGKDLSYAELIAAAEHAMERREDFIRNEGRDKILDSEDYQTMTKIRRMIRKHLGWEYEDPDKLAEWLTKGNDQIITSDVKYQLSYARDALNRLLEDS